MSEQQTLEKQLAIDISAAITEPIQHPLFKKKGVEVFIKREDRLHSIISGNKWRKLKYNILHALELNQSNLISMGGAYSNHLHALAYVGHQLGLKTTGLVRGDAIDNPTIRDLRSWNMELHFIPRDKFRDLRQFKHHDDLPAKEYQGYWIPEGGCNPRALTGVMELTDEITRPFTHIALACGTGTTLAGISKGLSNDKQVLGFAALKGADFLNHDVTNLIGDEKQNWSINLEYHFGGFGKTKHELSELMERFYSDTGIPLEPLYTGKMMYGLFDLIRKDYFKTGSRIIAIHTGGLQGTR